MTNCVRYNSEDNTHEVVIDGRTVGVYKDKGKAFHRLLDEDWGNFEWEEPETPDAWAKRAKEAVAAIQASQETKGDTIEGVRVSRGSETEVPPSSS